MYAYLKYRAENQLLKNNCETDSKLLVLWTAKILYC
jgi:hypothetical protein